MEILDFNTIRNKYLKTLKNRIQALNLEDEAVCEASVDTDFLLAYHVFLQYPDPEDYIKEGAKCDSESLKIFYGLAIKFSKEDLADIAIDAIHTVTELAEVNKKDI